MRSAVASNSIGMPVPTMSASRRSPRRAHESRSASVSSTCWPLRDELDGSWRPTDIVPVGLRICAASGSVGWEREGIGDVLGNYPIDQNHGEAVLSRGSLVAGRGPLRMGLPRPD